MTDPVQIPVSELRQCLEDSLQKELPNDLQ